MASARPARDAPYREDDPKIESEPLAQGAAVVLPSMRRARYPPFGEHRTERCSLPHLYQSTTDPVHHRVFRFRGRLSLRGRRQYGTYLVQRLCVAHCSVWQLRATPGLALRTIDRPVLRPDTRPFGRVRSPFSVIDPKPRRISATASPITDRGGRFGPE